MTLERYHELLGRLFDGELATDDAEELAQELRTHQEWREDLRQHLVLWEHWSQQAAPERSAEAFVAAWKTRVAAESDAAEFQATMRDRLKREANSTRTAVPFSIRQWWRSLHRPAALAWTAGIATVALVAIIALALPHSTAAAITLRGEAVCPACVLHIGHQHLPAIRVGHGDTARLYYLEANPALAKLQPFFCGGPTPAEATGREKAAANGHPVFQADRVTIPATPKPSPGPEGDQRILFPL